MTFIRMTPAQVIECAIGLFDDRDVPRGKRPPVLAAHILAELQQHGYRVESIPDPWCDWCGTALIVGEDVVWADRHGDTICRANDEDSLHEPAGQPCDAATTADRSTTDGSRAANCPSRLIAKDTP